ncbi:MAG: citramalate synthase [Oscillospiraceae bacterium]|nr:citramalate synthase [Oscillospiraceae bacterium]
MNCKNTKKLTFLDSTLRDGAQAQGMSFSVRDKLEIVKALDRFGVDFIEAGAPFAGPKEVQFFEQAKQLKLKNSQLVAFGSTRRKSIAAQDDESLQALANAGTSWVAVFGKASVLQVEKILETDKQTNLSMIFDTVEFLKQSGKKVIFDAEHFFDGYIADRAYAAECLNAAANAGADKIVLCDTNGATFPMQIDEIVKQLFEQNPDLYKKTAEWGIHTHNDRGMAEANSLTAVGNGITHIQGTFLGFGERCGNAKLATIIPDLLLCMGYDGKCRANLARLTETARKIAEISNISIKRNEPYIGVAAFAHKAGTHSNAVLKLPQSFEHIDPRSVGNERRTLTSELSGTSVILEKIKKSHPGTKITENAAEKLKTTLKQMEADGYQFEGAEASFDMLMRSVLGLQTDFFTVPAYTITDTLQQSGTATAQAEVCVSVGGRSKSITAAGNGPVNAFDTALRQALEAFYPALRKMHLIDYKVRVIDGGMATGSQVRVLVSSTDGENVWSTVGVSPDVIEASKIALIDSLNYYLAYFA